MSDSAAAWLRPVWVTVDLDAIRSNVAALVELAAPSEVCAVVKAGGYGHGSVEVAKAALDAGAKWLAVAVVDEAVILRNAAIDAPILLLSEPSPDATELAVELGLDCSVYTQTGIEALAKASRGGEDPVSVHLKVDTGMYRVGAQPSEVLDLARAIVDRPELKLGGLWTHLAVADEPGNSFTEIQKERFEAVRSSLKAEGIFVPLTHAANSAAAIDRPDLRYDMVRCGIATYGLNPSPALDGRVALQPALSLTAEVAHVKVVSAGEAISYGQRHRCDVDTVIATVPGGYADGVARRLSEVGGEVLIGGVRRPIVGTITMDQFLVDCGPPGEMVVAPGDEVVLIGEQGPVCITADDWASWLGTISYEVVCSISQRVPRKYRGLQ